MTIANNIAKIEHLFVEAQNRIFYETEGNILEIAEAYRDSPFPSIAFEAASSELGYQELRSAKKLVKWWEFYHASNAIHTMHMEIGLGWAFAKCDLNPEVYFTDGNEKILPNIVNGMGYFYALYKQKKTLLEQEIPQEIPNDFEADYFSGIGRRLWYQCKGNFTELFDALNTFPESRQINLWEGIGIASVYVGSLQASELDTMLKHSFDHRPGFEKGLAISLKYKILKDSDIQFTDMVCMGVFGYSAEEFKSRNLRAKAESELG